MQKEFWRKKRVLLTGHTGFKGAWMSLLLNELQAEVAGFSLPLKGGEFYCEVNASVAQHFEGDVRDKNDVHHVFTSFCPEIVIHFASHSSLDGNMEIPDYILETNYLGVLNLLEEIRLRTGVKAVIIVTSDKCYKESIQIEAYNEEYPLWADNPYSTSKVCQELLTECYTKTFFSNLETVNIATARASNVIAYGDHNMKRLIPYTVNCFLNGTKAIIRNPQAIRPWQYVLDVLWGYLLLAKKLYLNYGISDVYNGAYNFGPTEDGFAEVQQVVEILAESFQRTSYCFENDYNMRETKILKLDSKKAREILEWMPQYSLQSILREVADCAQKKEKGYCIEQLCRNIVRNYISEVSGCYQV